MVNIIFAPVSPEFAHAADEYSRIWLADRLKIIETIEDTTNLKFTESEINATVFEGRSQSHPMKLRASYDSETKKATIIHELLHRLSVSRMVKLPVKTGDRDLEIHKQIYLVLYDIWEKLYGTEFAARQVRVESSRTPFYDQAWKWALAFTKDKRREEFAKLCS